MEKYRVKTERGGIRVLRKTDLVIRDVQKNLKKGETVEDHIPNHQIQGEWTNVVVSKGVPLDTDEYEPRRLRQLYSIGCLEYLGEGTPTKIEKRPEEKELDEEFNKKTKSKK